MPDFLIVGAMKAGTTSLYNYLSTHPQLWLPGLKEPDFFVSEKNWSRGWDWYSSLFAEAPAGARLGEASTNYSKAGEFPGVPELIHEHLPDVRLIYLLRDPVVRLRSMYMHNVLAGREKRPAEVAILCDPMYLDASLYGRQLALFRSVFPEEQILVLQTELLSEAPQRELARAAAFLAVDPGFTFERVDRKANVSSERRAPQPAAASGAGRVLAAGARRLPPPLRGLARRLGTRAIDPRRLEVPSGVTARLADSLREDRTLLMSLADIDTSRWRSLDQDETSAAGS